MLIFKTEGFSEIDQQLTELVRDVQSPSEFKSFKKVLSMSVRNALKPLEQDLKARAPFDAEHNTSGIHLRETTRIDTRIPTAQDKKSVMVNESDSYIGTLSVKKSAVSLSQEFGNARTTAQPYLRITAQSGVEKATQVLKQELAERIPAYMKTIIKMRSK